jgi:hypothetical protein
MATIEPIGGFCNLLFGQIQGLFSPQVYPGGFLSPPIASVKEVSHEKINLRFSRGFGKDAHVRRV